MVLTCALPAPLACAQSGCLACKNNATFIGLYGTSDDYVRAPRVAWAERGSGEQSAEAACTHPAHPPRARARPVHPRDAAVQQPAGAREGGRACVQECERVRDVLPVPGCGRRPPPAALAPGAAAGARGLSRAVPHGGPAGPYHYHVRRGWRLRRVGRVCHPGAVRQLHHPVARGHRLRRLLPQRLPRVQGRHLHRALWLGRLGARALAKTRPLLRRGGGGEPPHPLQTRSALSSSPSTAASGWR